MTTAELLGNAALGVLALVVIWGLLQTLGVDIVKSLRDALIHWSAATRREGGFTTIQYVVATAFSLLLFVHGREPARRPLRARRGARRARRRRAGRRAGAASAEDCLARARDVVESIADGCVVAGRRPDVRTRRRPASSRRRAFAAVVVPDAPARLAARPAGVGASGALTCGPRRPRPNPGSSRSNGSRRSRCCSSRSSCWSRRCRVGPNDGTGRRSRRARPRGELVDDWPNADPAAAVLVATDVAADHGIEAA